MQLLSIHLEAMRIDIVLLIYQMCTINHHFLTIDLLWNHEITKANKRTDYENERELRRHPEYEEARERRAKIEARREQRTEQTQEIAVEMKTCDSVRDQALKGEFGMYGGIEEERFTVVELKTIDHSIWM